VIRVYVAGSAKAELDPPTLAMSKWNQAKVGERFAYTSTRADADVIVRVTGSEAKARSACDEAPWTASVVGCIDWAGWTVGAVTLDFLRNEDSSLSEAERLAAHELGHVLGLLHTASPPPGPHCLIMDPDATSTTPASSTAASAATAMAYAIARSCSPGRAGRCPETPSPLGHSTAVPGMRAMTLPATARAASPGPSRVTEVPS
jgi:hypothetical protein